MLKVFTTLIDSEELAGHLHDENWIVVDTRFDLADPDAGDRAYRQAHIEGAVYMHLDRDLSAPRAEAVNGGRHPLPRSEIAARTFGRFGIRAGTQVVAYDASGGMFAARLWWMLRWLGHADVAVLDGGWPAWHDAALPIESNATTRAPATFEIRKPLVEFVDAQQIADGLDRHDDVLLDARAPDRYDGSNETIDRVGGHIPGAVNAFFKDNLDAQGRFRSADALRARFGKIAQGRPVIHQCGSGVTACHNALAMAHAGLPEGRLYAGSWSEWIEDAQRPIATGR